MMRNIGFAALLGASLVVARAHAQTASIEFNVPGPADWNVDSNWTSEAGPFVPGDNFPAEVAAISNGGTAFLTADALFPIDGLLLDDGTLDLRNNGALTVVAGGGDAFGLTRVGAAGTLSMGGNGKLTTDTFQLNGTIARRVSGPSTGVVESVGAAALAGGLTVEFNNNFVPSVGQSWKIVDAAPGELTGAFTSVNAIDLARGLALIPSYDAANGDASVSVDSRLVLTIDRRSGLTTMSNVIGPAITIDGYTISSPAGQMSPSGWASLDDANTPPGWFEANPTSERLSELRPTGATAIANGDSFNLGAAFAPADVPFGTAVPEDVSFTYFSPDGSTEQGIVEYQGLHNNLVLLVDPETGAAAIQNQSTFGISLDFYTITSASGSLDPDGWSSLDDQNVGSWAEANPTNVRLSELYPVGGSAFAPGQGYEIGDAFTAGGEQDLQIRFTFADGTAFDGIVEYGEFDLTPVGQIGDTDNDGDVDLDDLNAVRNNFGAVGQIGSTPGDAFPFDGTVDLDDLNGVRNNFGAGGSSSVPEPATWCLALAGLPLVVRGLRRR